VAVKVQPPLPTGLITQLVMLIVSVDGLTRNVKLVSDDENPDAVTPTVMPLGPAAGVIVILGVTVVTVNVARAKSPVLPLTWIVCAPGAAVLEAVKEALTVPLAEIEHEGNVTMSGNGILVTGRHEPASAGLNPLPVIVTPVPTGPELGLRMIEGTRGKVGPGVMIAVAKSPPALVTLMVYELIEDVNQLLSTVKEPETLVKVAVLMHACVGIVVKMLLPTGA
jgi:hypothetical protein